jgi:hypothetical protein
MNECNNPAHGAINAERAESRGLRKAWIAADGKSQYLERELATVTAQRDQMEAALMLAARWGISSDGYSAEVSSRIRCWIIGGMKGEAPKAPDYYPANVQAMAAADTQAPTQNGTH